MSDSLKVAGINIRWEAAEGRCFFAGLPVIMLWTDSTLAGLMAGVQAMVGTPRFLLALQGQGRQSVEADWQVISGYATFEEGFNAIATIAAVAGWGSWELVSLNRANQTAVFRVRNSWEAHYQRALGVQWGSGMLAGKFAGYSAKLFGENCWAEQTGFIVSGDEYDEFVIKPSDRSIEHELEALLASDEATRADMAVALVRLNQEVARRVEVEQALLRAQGELEAKVAERTAALARVNNELGHSEKRFRRIFEATPMGIHVYELHDDALIFAGANPAADTILGVDNQQFLGMTIEAAFPPLATTEIPSRYREVLSTGVPWRNEQVIYRDDRLQGAFEVYAFALDVGRLVVQFMDISERIRAQNDREELNNRLHRARKMEALGLLAGGVAHDLNNILAGVVSYPDLLISRLPPADPMVKSLLVIHEAGVRAAAVVSELLSVTRGGQGHHAPLRLRDMAEDYLSSIEAGELRNRYAGIRVDTAWAPEPLTVLGSVLQLRKALMNLVVNAMEATEDSGWVRVETSRRQLSANASPERSLTEYAVLSVEDSGKGISSEDLERIFEPFYSRKVMGRSGTGLGLTLVWNTVTDHGGLVEVHSTGSGTRFDMLFPLIAAVAEEVSDDSPESIPKGNGELVLVVDDEPLQREVAAGILSHLNYRVLSAASGAEAVEMARISPPAIVLLDMIMPPGMSGRDTYAELLQIQPGLPAVIASGFAETDEVRETLKLGAGVFLGKPYVIQNVGRAIHQELDRARRK